VWFFHTFFSVLGEICKPFRRLSSLDDIVAIPTANEKLLSSSSNVSTKNSTLTSTPQNDEENYEWTISFEQFDTAMNGEMCIVTWFETKPTNIEDRIANYNQDFLR